MLDGARRFHINFDRYTTVEKLSTILSDVNLTYISANSVVPSSPGNRFRPNIIARQSRDCDVS